MLHKGLAGLLTALALLAFTVQARAEEAFEVQHIPVDVTAANASLAREKALAQGQMLALRALLAKLTLPQQQASLPQPAAGQVDSMVRDFQIEQEKTSAVRYIAKLTYRFRPEAVRALLRQAGVPYSETVSKPVAVVPVWRAQGGATLWDDPNPWRDVWSNAVLPNGLVPLVVPSGGLADVSAIMAAQAIAGDKTRLAALAQHYDTTDTLVTVATLAPDGQSVAVTATAYGSIGQGPVYSGRVAVGPGGVAQALAPVVAAIDQSLENRWKQATQIVPGQTQSLAVTVPLTGLSDLLAVRRGLAQVRTVRDVQTTFLSRTEAHLTLAYDGGLDQLSLALAQNNLTLAQGGDTWTLRPVAGTAPTAPAPAPSLAGPPAVPPAGPPAGTDPAASGDAQPR